MENTKGFLEHLVERLRTQGYRLTPQRMAILSTIVYSHIHPTAEEIYQQVAADFPMISLATVYKTLNVLKNLGIVAELQMDGSSHYDRDLTPHPHLVCVQCHSIADLPPETMSKMSQEALSTTGFRALWYDIKIYGLCAQCQAQGEETADPLMAPCLFQSQTI
ncbi:MAG: transcriptional repressor [Anaerolineae bacterium]|jgi:Fur family peroxide stress response transcriptional regulator|nr:transcriptional repressor [Anaerolineae bacterium]MDH7473979.1 transcriptional repressor [Anaerolineae bacterium]